MSNALMIRGLMELHNDRNDIYLMPPNVTDVTACDGRVILRSRENRMVTLEEHAAELDCDPSFLGFSGVFCLDTEDAITHVRISDVRLKHRVIVVRPKTRDDLLLCLLLFAVETLPLTRRTLLELLEVLGAGAPPGRPEDEGRTAAAAATGSRISRTLRHSCLRLTYSSLYLFFDETAPEVMWHVPKIFVLHKETRRARAEVLADIYFRLRRFDRMMAMDLCFITRETREGGRVLDIVTDVANEECRAFYVPMAAEKGRTVTWLSNDVSSP